MPSFRRSKVEWTYAAPVPDMEQAMRIACDILAEGGTAAARLRLACIRFGAYPSQVINQWGDPRAWHQTPIAD